MKKNNKGFTLIELITTMAIMSVVALGVGLLMTSSTNMYSTVQTNINLQYESQIVMTQMQEFILETSGGILWDDTNNIMYTLDLVDTDDDGIIDEKKMQTFVLYDNKLYYDINRTPNDDDGDNTLRNIIGTSVNPANFDLMGQYLSEIDLLMDTDIDNTILDVTMTFNFQKRSAEYTGEQIVSLRNSPVFENANADIMDNFNQLLLYLNN